jgi:exodeoxyribonuclease V beta subunit
MTSPERAPAPLDVFTTPLAGCTLVEASAGTGKTWAICGLVLRLLLEARLPVQQVLVVTFTKAATAELKDRIRTRIDQALQRLRDGAAAPADADTFIDTLLDSQRARGLDDATLAALLDQALQDFDDAAIFTIHAWCQRALSDTPLAAGLPLHQDMQADDSMLRLQVAQDFWRCEIVHGGLPPRLLAHLAQRGDSPQQLAALLQRRQAKPMARMRWPEALDAPDAEPAPAEAEAALAAAFAAAQAAWAAGRDEFLAALDEALPRLNKSRLSAGAIAAATTQWDALLAGTDPMAEPEPDAKKQRLALFTATPLKPNAGKPPMAEHPFPALAQALLALREAIGESLGNARLRLVRRWLDTGPTALQQAKRQARTLAYDDLLLNLHQRLAGTGGEALAQALRQRYPAALIDEFQDTDPVQYAIFRRLYQAPGAALPLFLVGDPKQAIYSFRHADLRTYLRARDAATREATLGHNQRSVPLLVQACNALFGRHPAPFRQPGLRFTPVGVGAKQRVPLHEAGPPRAPLQLWALPAEPALSKAQAEAAAAAATASEIARLLAQAMAGELRLGDAPAGPGDMAVLVRSHRQGALMRQALQACGVASVEQSQASLWDSPDAEELQQVLAAVLAPTHAGTVRAALATTLLGLDADAVAALAGDEAAMALHVQALDDLRLAWARRGIGAMLRRLQAAYDLPARLLARLDGERRMTNWLHLAECLQQAAGEHTSPEALLRWLQAQRRDPLSRDAEASQLRLESDRHRVQIVTIHRSKGLEYPFVFCPFLFDGAAGGGGPGLEGREGFDAATGEAVIDFRPLPKKHPDLDAWQKAAREERDAENLRLVYVALTRAVQRCTLVVGPYFTVHGKQHSASFKQAASSPLQWLLTGQDSTDASPQTLHQAWADFAQEQAERAPGSVQCQALPIAGTLPLPTPPPAPDAVAALPGPRRLPEPWRMGSYSSLTLGARHEAAAVDHDRRLLPDQAGNDQPPLPPTPADDILAFPRGAAAGECLHAVFEHIDFTDPATWAAAIDAALAQQAAELPGARPEAVRTMLTDVLNTPLIQTPAGPLQLAQVPTARRLNELEFTLPAPALQPGALQALLHQHGLAGPVLAFAPLQGYLRGFIDLVFEHDGRFHVLDWKSNHLGSTPADYAPAALAAAMSAQGYHLQLLLYTLALHRWLQQRLPGYDYDSHIGPGLYLFVRGVRPGWRTDAGAPCGVHAWRPSLALVEALGALLGPADAAPGGPSLQDVMAEMGP